MASAISGVSIGKMMKFMLWFIFSLLVVLMLVTYVPQISLALPSLMGYVK